MESVWFATHPPDPALSDDLVDGAHVHTVVAGAGLTGLTTAVLLARSGQRVAVLEARRLGAVTTGNTTAKVSLLQGTVLSEIRRHQPDEVLRAYVEANREGKAWLLRYLEGRGISYQTRSAWTYAEHEDALPGLREELEACRTAGLEADWRHDTELPFKVAGAICLGAQAQIHPLVLLEALLVEFRAHGGTLVENARVTRVDPGSQLVVTTTRGRMTAERLVIATGTPILDRGAYFAKLTPLRSYATTYRVPTPVPQGMYLSIDAKARSLRTVPVEDGELLLVGGNGHVVGRHAQGETAAVSDLQSWTAGRFPGAEPAHAWSAQDYRSLDRVPFVGPMPRAGGRIFVATGYNKWGMTNAVAAALSLSSQILNGHTPWADTLGRRSTSPASAVSAVTANAETGVEAARDWVRSELHALSGEPPTEGSGVVGRSDKGLPEGVSTVAGVTCRVSAVCTHLGGVLRWNDEERSWDCPLHGSRFTAGGALLEGPAVKDLPRHS